MSDTGVGPVPVHRAPASKGPAPPVMVSTGGKLEGLLHVGTLTVDISRCQNQAQVADFPSTEVPTLLTLTATEPTVMMLTSGSTQVFTWSELFTADFSSAP